MRQHKSEVPANGVNRAVVSLDGDPSPHQTARSRDSERMFPLTQFVPAVGRIVPRSPVGSVKNIVRYIVVQRDDGKVRMNDVRFVLRQYLNQSGFLIP